MLDAFSMLAYVVIGFFIGVKTDKYLNTSPLFTILFSFMGIGTHIYSLIRKK